MDKSINLSNDKNFVNYPYLQSKKIYKTITDSIWKSTTDNSNSHIKDTENPFSVFYKTEN